MISSNPLSIPNNPTEKRFLVLDLDNTTIAPRKQNPKQFLSKANPHLLSPEIIEQAKNGHYDGIIICTHRTCETDAWCIEKNWAQIEKVNNTMAQYLSDAKTRNLSIEDYSKSIGQYKEVSLLPDLTDLEKSDGFISCIIKNLETATSLKCLIVSTPEDTNDICGSGFEKKLKPYEEAALNTIEIIPQINGQTKTIYHFPPLPLDHYKTLDLNASSKNPQLIQIAQWVTEQYPDNKITLDFIDDVPTILSNAKKIDSNELSSNITLNIHHHSAFGATPIILQDTVQGSYQTSLNPAESMLVIHSLFTTANNTTTVTNQKPQDLIRYST